MRRAILSLLAVLVLIPTALMAASEWWWRVIEWIMENGGTWNVW